MKFDFTDAVFTVGLVVLCVGLGAYDWRWAAICAGVVLLGVTLAPAFQRKVN